jgi:predicted ATP-dependent protease
MARAFRRPVPVGSLRWTCPATAFPERRRGRTRLLEVIGQDDAVAALRLGLELYGPGFNLYVSGLPGVGKTSLVETLLREMTPRCALPADRVYVNDFRHPERPSLVELPRGRGVEFLRAVSDLVQGIAAGIRSLAADEAYSRRREEVLSRARAEERVVIDGFEALASARGFTLATPTAARSALPDVFYVLSSGGPSEPRDAGRRELVAVDDLDAAVRAGRLDAEAVPRLRAEHDDLRERLTSAMRRLHEIGQVRRRSLDALDREAAERIARAAFEEVRREFPYPAVEAWLADAARALVERFPAYARRLSEPGEGEPAPRPDEEVLREFRANLLLEATNASGCPVVVEENPTWANLFGQIERHPDPRGGPRSDFLHVRAGSLLRADGGYLVVQAVDLLSQDGVWDELKRVLRHRRLEIRPPESQVPSAPVVLRPEPIPINVKVVLIGDERTYHGLRGGDPDFNDTFKVKASFQHEVPLTRSSLGRYADFVGHMEREEGLLPASPDGLAALAEEAVREAGRRGRISVRFGRLADLVRESDYEARRREAARIEAPDVLAACAARARRHNARELLVRDAVREGLVLISTEGRRVGEVNGLAIYDFGDWQFGRVARITAAVGAGREGVINVEREVSLSASSYDKGVHILSGYLRHVFARTKDAAFTASLVFEQSYGGIAGDSATCAETCAIVSALSGLPLRQDLAITGSMNQHGEVQAVGDVNEKVEGFFDLCADRGLTGSQGVVLPRSNVKDLMLRHDVVEACRARKFAVYSIAWIEEGIELLTGVPAGLTRSPGKFRKGSVFAAVAENLGRLSSG